MSLSTSLTPLHKVDDILYWASVNVRSVIMESFVQLLTTQKSSYAMECVG